MAKVNQPKVTSPATPEIEIPTVDYSSLLAELMEQQTASAEYETKGVESNIECALIAYMFREKNPDAVRSEIKLCVDTAVASVRGFKADDIAKSPEKPQPNASPASHERYSKLRSACDLSSKLLSVAWPKGEDEQKKVKKLIDSGERGFVKLTRAAAKRHKNPARDPNAKRFTITNFAEKLELFIVSAATDLSETREDTLQRASEVIETLKLIPKA